MSFTPPASIQPYLPAANVVSGLTAGPVIGDMTEYTYTVNGKSYGVAVLTRAPQSTVLIKAASNASWQQFLLATTSVPLDQASGQAAEAWFNANIAQPYYPIP
jgi:hypothetical protein